MKKNLRYILPFLVFVSVCFFSEAAEPIRILAIGNSFSEDAVEQNFRDIADSEGVDIVVANLYYGGCTVDMHYDYFVSKSPVYRYRKILRDGRVVEKQKATIQSALHDDKWDYISFQQGSQFSGDFNSLGRLPELMRLVRAEVGEHPVFMWHETWAYSIKTTHKGFENYGKSQLQMFHDIVETSRMVMDTYPEIKILIPAGTAIQDARTAILAGDDLTRDGYHLEKTVGRYIAACTWFSAIFRRILDEDCYCPKGVSPRFKRIALESAHEAVMHPWSIVPLPVVK